MNQQLDHESRREQPLSPETQAKLFAAYMGGLGNNLDPLPSVWSKIATAIALVVVFFLIGALGVV